jgi:hypothetical protein
LAPKGINLQAIVVASDVENLDLATLHGFHSIWWSNEFMGSKWNAGFAHAANHGADLFVLAGSDDWIHPTAFDHWPLGCVSTARSLDFVDLDRGVVQHAHAEHLIPWLVPRSLLEPKGFRPFPDRMQRGTEAMLRGALGMPEMVERDGIPGVDFKTSESVSPYAGVRNSIGDGIEHDLSILAEHYPAHLVESALDLSKEHA